MASLGQIIFGSMVTLIIVFSALIILFLALAFSGSTSEVMSSNTAPIANLGQDALLSCYLKTYNEDATIRKLSVTWEREPQGIVYQYKDGAPDLKDQNSQFRGRTELFPHALVAGNASLLMRTVRRNDEGNYTCRISSSAGGGKITIRLRAAAYTAPKFALTDARVLTATASRWFPKPNVTWLSSEGDVLQGTTRFTQNSPLIYSVDSKLSGVNDSSTYTCRIENDLVMSVSQATVTGTSVSGNTYFTFSAASSLLASTHLMMMAAVLCLCRLITRGLPLNLC